MCVCIYMYIYIYIYIYIHYIKSIFNINCYNYICLYYNKDNNVVRSHAYNNLLHLIYSNKGYCMHLYLVPVFIVLYTSNISGKVYMINKALDILAD